MPTKTHPWSSADALRDKEGVAAYLNAVLEEVFETGDASILSRALGVIAKSRGMSALAKDTGLGRESLYKSLSADGNPSIDTVLRVTRALDIKLHAKASRTEPEAV